MKSMKLKLITLILVLLSPLTATANQFDFNIENVKKAMEKTYRPFNSELMFLDVNGEVFLATDNGRYLMRPKTGIIYDLWYRTTVESVSDLKDVPKLHLSKLSLNVDTLNTYTLNPESKAPMVHVFIDPMGPSNRALFELVDDLKDDYKFKFIVIPSSDPLSVEATQKLACNDAPKLGLKAILSQDFSKLKATKNASCQQKVIIQTSTFASTLKIRNMPTIVTPEGDVSVGFNGDLASVLSEKKDD